MCVCRSTVLKAMFAHENTKESVEQVVHLTDAKPDAVKCMLEYIYTEVFLLMDAQLSWPWELCTSLTNTTWQQSCWM